MFLMWRVNQAGSRLTVTRYPVFWLSLALILGLGGLSELADSDLDGVFLLAAVLVIAAIARLHRHVFDRDRRLLTTENRGLLRSSFSEYSLDDLHSVEVAWSKPAPAAAAQLGATGGSWIELVFADGSRLPLSDSSEQARFRPIATAIAEFLDATPPPQAPSARELVQGFLGLFRKGSARGRRGTTPGFAKARSVSAQASGRTGRGQARNAAAPSGAADPGPSLPGQRFFSIVAGVLLVALGFVGGLLTTMALVNLADEAARTLLDWRLGALSLIWLFCLHLIVTGLMAFRKGGAWPQTAEVFCRTPRCAVVALVVAGLLSLLVGAYWLWSLGKSGEGQVFVPILLVYLGVRLPLRALRVARAGVLPSDLPGWCVEPSGKVLLIAAGCLLVGVAGLPAGSLGVLIDLQRAASAGGGSSPLDLLRFIGFATLPALSIALLAFGVRIALVPPAVGELKGLRDWLLVPFGLAMLAFTAYLVLIVASGVAGAPGALIAPVLLGLMLGLLALVAGLRVRRDRDS